MLAAVGQLCSSANILSNLKAAVRIINGAADQGAAAVFLPEATDFIAPAANVSALTRSPENAQFVEGIQSEARKRKVFVSVGIHEPPGQAEEAESQGRQRGYNTHLLIDNEGSVVSRYRKLHLFDVDIPALGYKIKESDTTIPGQQLVPPALTPIGAVGLLTCYDLRFPEVSLALRRQKAQILTYPSAFTVSTGRAHWEVLLRARATETQCYVLAAAQIGAHEGTKRTSWGHAMAIDPYGKILAQCQETESNEPSFCLADIDLEFQSKIRTEMPLWDQRRYDKYPQL